MPQGPKKPLPDTGYIDRTLQQTGVLHSPFVLDRSQVHIIDGNLIVGMTSLQMLRDKARLFTPEEVQNFADWAQQHPTVDPRTWVPVARAGIEPWSQIGKQVAVTDTARQAQDGTLGMNVGVPGVPPHPPDPSQPVKHDPNIFSSAMHGFTHAVKTVGGAVLPDPVGDVFDAYHQAVGGIPETIHGIYNLDKGAIRVGTGALMDIGYTASGIAGFRAAQGEQRDRENAAKMFHLTREEQDFAFFGVGKAGSHLDIAKADRFAKANPGAGMQPWDSFDPDAQQRIRDAVTYWNDPNRPNAGQNVLGRYARETITGQYVLHPEWLGQKLDASGNLVQDRGLNIAGSPAYQAATAQAALDLPMANGKAMTWGRAVAYPILGPDSAAATVLSGFVDWQTLNATDPLNAFTPEVGALAAIPSIAVRSGLRRAGVEVAPHWRTVARATRKAEAPQAVVRAQGLRFQPGGLPGRAVAEAAPARAREADVVARARAAGAPTIEETGLTRGPNGLYVLPQVARDFITRGRGAEAVRRIAATSSETEIHALTNGLWRHELVAQAAKLSTEEEIRALIGPRLGHEIEDIRGFARIGRGGPAVFQARGLLESGGVFSMDPYRRNYQQGLEWAQRTGRTAAGEEPSLATKVGAGARSLSSFGRGYWRGAPVAASLSVGHPDHNADTLIRAMGSARIPLTEAAPYIDRALQARNSVQLQQAVESLYEEVVRRHLPEGLSDQVRDQLVQMYSGPRGHEYANTYANADINSFAAAPGNVGRASLLSERAHDIVPIPNVRNIRRHTGGIGRVLSINDQFFDAMQAASDYGHAVTSAWRNWVLVRSGYTPREIGELLFSMGIGGFHSLFTNPAAWIGSVYTVALSKELSQTTSRTARIAGGPLRATQATMRSRPALHLAEGLRWLNPSLSQQAMLVNGEPLWAAYERIQAGSHEVAPIFDAVAGMHRNYQMDENNVRAASKTVRTLHIDDAKLSRQYNMAYIEKLHAYAGDQEARNIADANVTMRTTMKEFAQTTHDPKMQMRPDLLDGTRKKATQYIRGMEADVNTLSLGQARLREAIATNSYNGKPLINTSTKGLPKYNEDLMADLETMKADPATKELMPPVLHDWGNDYTKARWGHRFVHDFFTIVGDWADLLARGPLIQQAYAREVKKLAPQLSPQARADAIKALRDGKDFKSAALVASAPINPVGVLTTEDMNMIASWRVRRTMEKTFYNAHRRQNYALAARVVMPFAQATFNTFRRWGEMALRNPVAAYRTTRPLQEMMMPGSAALYGVAESVLPGNQGLDALYTPNHPEASVNALFYTDTYGDRKVGIPMVGPLTWLMPNHQGLPGVYQLSIGSLNMAGLSLFPGSNPMLTFAESMIVPDVVYRDDWIGAAARMTQPYGLPKGSYLDRAFGSFAPTYFRRLQATSDRDQASSMTIKAMGALASTRDYPQNALGESMLLNDSKEVGWRLGMLSAIGTFFSPGSFSPEFFVKIKGDPTGAGRQWMLMARVRQEYQKYTKAQPGQDPREAHNQGTANFIDQYGGTALFSVMPTTQVKDGPQSTNDIWHFRNANPQTYEHYKDVVGYFFAGGDPQQNFSREFYDYQKAHGERVSTDPKDYRDSVEKEFGWYWWNRMQKDVLLLPKEQRGVARNVLRQNLEQQFPPWTLSAVTQDRFETDMGKLRTALKDPVMASLPSAAYIEKYLEVHDEAVSFLRHHPEYGTDNLDTKAAWRANVTQQVIDTAEYLMAQDTSGGFTNAWSRLFQHEFTPVDQPEAKANEEGAG